MAGARLRAAWESGRIVPLGRGEGAGDGWVSRVGLPPLAVAALAWACLLATPAPASSTALAGFPRIEIIGPDEVLREHTVESSDGTRHFVHPNGARVRLLTSVHDPEIRNAGDGDFHPASEEDVESALRAIDPRFLADLEVRIFLLPLPRSGMLGSSADGEGIYLTPGVRPYLPSEVHFLVAHEIGHVFHRRHVPYGNELWSTYRILRGLEDEERFRFDGPHADRPQEILAEDFRVLFGGSLARGDGAVENSGILRPDEVPGLAGFFFERVGDVAAGWGTQDPVAASPDFRVLPNPARAGDAITLWLERGDGTPRTEGRSNARGAGSPRLRAVAGSFDAAEILESVDLYDAGGRRVTTVSIKSRGDELAVDLPSSLAPGAYWLRIRWDDGGARTVSLRVLGR